jgi:hypothetical protein
MTPGMQTELLFARYKTVTLDLVRTEDLIPGALPNGWELKAGKHLFERIHGKDPFVVIDQLEKLGWGTRKYSLREVV